MNETTLQNLALPLKALFTGYLLAIGLGLLTAVGRVPLTHGMADGKPGLSIDDIVYSSFTGDRQFSFKIELKLNGSMKDNAPPEVRLHIIKWGRHGAPQADRSRISRMYSRRIARCATA